MHNQMGEVKKNHKAAVQTNNVNKCIAANETSFVNTQVMRIKVHELSRKNGGLSKTRTPSIVIALLCIFRTIRS